MTREWEVGLKGDDLVMEQERRSHNQEQKPFWPANPPPDNCKISVIIYTYEWTRR